MSADPRLPISAHDSQAPRGRFSVAMLFASAGGLVGFALGIIEGVLLFTTPRASGLLKPDTRYVVLFLAPLADAIPFATLGFLLGLPAVFLVRPRPALSRMLGSIGIGAAGAYLAWTLDWFRIGLGLIFPSRLEVRTPVVAFALFTAGAWAVLWFIREKLGVLRCSSRRHVALRIFQVTSAFATLCVAGIVLYAMNRPYPSSPPSTPVALRGRPNIVLIVMDTVRADHLSCYGYRRPTTPFIDSLAARGVMFQDAVAPTSWTLPALASIFTGLLPHQHGAGWAAAMSQQPWTLAKILRAMGYETSGFSANPFYGLGAWGLDHGFDEYMDDSYSVRHNLAVTFTGQTLYRFLYRSLLRYNQFNHRDAEDVNSDVLRWYQHRSNRPYFLFINYMDAHRPYLPPASYDHRFGRISKSLLARISASFPAGHPATLFSATENQQLIDAYDNSLAYLDTQMGRLVQTLLESPGGANTFVIITADHGEGFGDHGTYDHGYNLYSEVLHVPLIVQGPGVPAGRRIPDLVGTRRLFATVLDLAAGGKLPLSEASLQGYWQGTGAPQRQDVISELEVRTHSANRPAEISLRNQDWHLILDSRGSASLFNWQQDPEERLNQADVAGLLDLRASLNARLRAAVGQSVLPWLNLGYLKPLDLPGQAFIQQLAARKSPWPAAGRPIGSSQALFKHATSQKPNMPEQQERENLRSLPY
ncbi:MAG TPA: sulfatase [Terriglobia bacterium]|nr:sulfatase [Terriglobia bacterium]